MAWSSSRTPQMVSMATEALCWGVAMGDAGLPEVEGSEESGRRGSRMALGKRRGKILFKIANSKKLLN